MRTEAQPLEQIPIRAPQASGDYLIRGACWEPNPQIRKALDQRFPYAAATRLQVWQKACQWTGQYLDEDLAAATATGDYQQPFLVSGHQPELFHPGVWFKSFVLDGWARTQNRVAINLVIDNDQQNQNWLAFPAVRSGQTETARESYASGGIGLPYEERRFSAGGEGAADRFESLPWRVMTAKADFVPAQCLLPFWERALPLRELPSMDVPGYRFAAARHQWEWDLGLRNYEVPLSQVCQTEGFSQFAFELCSDAVRFWEVYNGVLHEYRRLNGVEGDQRPVPDLEAVGDWLEMPFWIWSSEYPHRQRLFIQPLKVGFWLANEQFVFQKGEAGGTKQRIHSPEALLPLGGWKLRTRALTTTMFSRSILSDGFLHGIGGAIYDQLTDEIFRRWSGLDLGTFLTATATMRLQGPHHGLSQERLQKLQHELRQRTWKPERFVSSESPLWPVVLEKRQWIDELPVENRWQWQQKMETLNHQLRQESSSHWQRLTQEIESLQKGLASQKVEDSREWSFLLFDLDLPNRLQAMAQQALQRYCEAVNGSAANGNLVEVTSESCN